MCVLQRLWNVRFAETVECAFSRDCGMYVLQRLWNVRFAETVECAFCRDSGMNYNAHGGLEDWRALASFIDHHHVHHHTIIDNSFTLDYAVRA